MRMIKNTIKVVVLVVVFGGLLLGAVKANQNSQAKQQASTSSQTSALQSKLNAVTAQVNSVSTQYNAYKNEATTQFNADKSALCGFITSHVNTKTVAVPSECTTP